MSDGNALIVENPAPGVRSLRLNRPDVHNAIDMALFECIDAELAKAADDDEVRVIVLCAEGGKAFSAGFDISEMAGFDGPQMIAAFERRDPLMKTIAAYRCPVIAAIDGICYGAGALMSLAADIRIASTNFRFKVTAADYGGANATWSLPRLVGPALAKEILMAGQVIEASRAANIGLVNRVVDPADIDRETVELAAAIAAKPPAGVAGIKRLVDASFGENPVAGWQAEYDWMVQSMRHAKTGGADVFDSFLSKKG